MYNNVVMTLEKAYQNKGYATLRFNFRGTGNSTGDYDTFYDFCDDVVAVHGFLSDQGFSDIALAGYSFGSWVNAHSDNKLKGLIHQLVISPPVSFMDFSQVKGFLCDSFIVCGDRDDYAYSADLKKYLESWNVSSFKSIKGCDHFYSGMLEQLQFIIEDTI